MCALLFSLHASWINRLGRTNYTLRDCTEVDAGVKDYDALHMNTARANKRPFDLQVGVRIALT